MHKNERRPINSDLLRTFSVIAGQGQLTTAAAMLGRTQSAISVQLRKLEDDLGAQLFTRTPQGMELTPRGQKLLPVAQAALDELSQVRRLFDDPLTGAIRVGIPDDYDDFVLEQVLAEFARDHPAVEIAATSGCTMGFAGMIARDVLDVAVVSRAAGGEHAPIAKVQTVWAIGASTRLDTAQPIPLVLLDRNCWWKDLATKALDDAGKPYRVAFTSSSFASLKAAIRAGLGVGVLPAHSLNAQMRRLGAADGFPALPVAHRSILTNLKSAPNLTCAMADALRDKV